MSNAERRLKNEEVEIRGTNESRISTNKVSFLASRILSAAADRLLNSTPLSPLHTERDPPQYHA